MALAIGPHERSGFYGPGHNREGWRWGFYGPGHNREGGRWGFYGPGHNREGWRWGFYGPAQASRQVGTGILGAGSSSPRPCCDSGSAWREVQATISSWCPS